MDNLTQEIDKTVRAILEDYSGNRTIDYLNENHDLPNREAIIQIIESLLKIVYPGYIRDQTYKNYHPENHIATLIEDVIYRLNQQILKVGKYRESFRNHILK